ncbi:HAD family hydrolase [Sphingomonas naphthae]|uniref:HAD family hydrolase n=1 Tax=Sphingomonas naphthae TaxID=1813468 RepID=A0ABY7TIF2_9SPHN|nr:HAD family hydrolase [Sphingomonas naphthae]WCT72978.1 HAD family hydrolase [Sphingomonas naphthae]
MSRPLLITDCDEVLLHMVTHFGAWLDEAHGVNFSLDTGHFVGAISRAGTVLEAGEIWPLLDGFFATEMHRQTAVPHAVEALEAIGEVADIVVLTNLDWPCHAGRVAQLASHGVNHRVVCNQGGKGTPLAKLLEEYRPSVAVFVDDLAVHHESVAEAAPQVHRLHMVAEPRIAPKVPKAPFAHARIDDWRAAKEWILARFVEGPAKS